METVWTDMMTLLERRGDEGVEKKEEGEVHRQKERRGWRHVLIIPLVALTNELRQLQSSQLL
jgi:hypothetical protein